MPDITAMVTETKSSLDAVRTKQAEVYQSLARLSEELDGIQRLSPIPETWVGTINEYRFTKRTTGGGRVCHYLEVACGVGINLVVRMESAEFDNFLATFPAMRSMLPGSAFTASGIVENQAARFTVVGGKMIGQSWVNKYGFDGRGQTVYEGCKVLYGNARYSVDSFDEDEGELYLVPEDEDLDTIYTTAFSNLLVIQS